MKKTQVNLLGGRLLDKQFFPLSTVELGEHFLGFQLETLTLGHLRQYLSQTDKYFPIYHYTINGSYDIDFIVQTKKPVMGKRGAIVCIEVKFAKNYRSEWVKGMRDFCAISRDEIKGKHVIYCGQDILQDDDIHIWPFQDFMLALFEGKIL